LVIRVDSVDQREALEEAKTLAEAKTLVAAANMAAASEIRVDLVEAKTSVDMVEDSSIKERSMWDTMEILSQPECCIGRRKDRLNQDSQLRLNTSIITLACGMEAECVSTACFAHCTGFEMEFVPSTCGRFAGRRLVFLTASTPASSRWMVTHATDRDLNICSH